jgi:hypothetical protein
MKYKLVRKSSGPAATSTATAKKRMVVEPAAFIQERSAAAAAIPEETEEDIRDEGGPLLLQDDDPVNNEESRQGGDQGQELYVADVAPEEKKRSILKRMRVIPPRPRRRRRNAKMEVELEQEQTEPSGPPLEDTPLDEEAPSPSSSLPLDSSRMWKKQKQRSVLDDVMVECLEDDETLIPVGHWNLLVM